MVKQGIPNTSELDDDQIEALIRKLSAIKGSAPELLAALHNEANSRIASSRSGSRASTTQARAGGGGGGGGGPVRGGGRETGAIRPVYEDEEDDDDYHDEETESEEDDEFDEDGPCVGHGYSDEVSVISEMTTPTVVSHFNVPEEERYNEIQQGYGAASRNKKPDFLSQVHRVNAARDKKQQQQQQRPPPQSKRNTNNSSNSDLDPTRRKAYTSGLSAMAKISEGEPAAVSKPERPARPERERKHGSSSALRAPQPPRRQHSRDGSPTAPTRKYSGDITGEGTSVKNKTGRGLKKKPSGDDSKEEPGVAGSKSPSKVRTVKKSSSNSGHNKSKSVSSYGSNSGSKGSKGSGERKSPNNDKGFANDWHKSLSGADFDENDMDGDGFPFSFGDDTKNAFGASKSSGGWGDRSPAATKDAFDPFDAADAGFDSFQGKTPLKKMSSKSRSKREASPKRKPAPR